MRNFASRLFSVLLLSWYLFTVAGFDVHRSCECGRLFIKPLFAGISCERIHPDVECPGEHEGHCEDEEDCCTDSIYQILLTGEYAPAPFSFDSPQMAVVSFPVFNFSALFLRDSKPFFGCAYPPGCRPPALAASSILKA